MTTTILKEGTLNDDTLYQADEGKIFPNGYIAILEYWTFANSWSNHKHVKCFRKYETMQAYINKNYQAN